MDYPKMERKRFPWMDDPPEQFKNSDGEYFTVLAGFSLKFVKIVVELPIIVDALIQPMCWLIGLN